MTVAPWTLELEEHVELVPRATRARVLYTDHGPRVRGFLVGMLGTRAVDDALQETFARAFAHDPWPPRAEETPWVFGIARNVAYEARRAARRAPILGCTAEPIAPHASPEATAISRQRTDHVVTALAGLPDDRRAALLLRVYQGLSCDDVARAMGWSVAKVKTEVFRARRHLRDAVSGGHDE